MLKSLCSRGLLEAKLREGWLTAPPADVRDPGGVGAEPVRDVLPLGRGRVERRPVEEQEVGGGHLAHGRPVGDHVQQVSVDLGPDMQAVFDDV